MRASSVKPAGVARERERMRIRVRMRRREERMELKREREGGRENARLNAMEEKEEKGVFTLIALIVVIL